MFYKWIGQFSNGDETHIVTLKMHVTSRRYADEIISDKVANMVESGFNFLSGTLFRTDKDYRPMR